MDDDDFDFTPSSNTSSNLASLFGFIKKPLPGNSNLTYTAPKPPKKENTSSKNQQQKEENTNKSTVIFYKPVQAYKYENKVYIHQGLTGIVITRNHMSHNYDIILYKPSKETLVTIGITKFFTLTVSANNYVSFYDSNNQNWSIMFQSSNDLEEFLEKSFTNSFVDVTYSTFSLDEQSVIAIKDNIKEKIHLSDSSSLAKGLAGCSENSKRVVILPNLLCDSSFTNQNVGKHLLLKINIGKIVSELQNTLINSKSVEEEVESPNESSSEDLSNKAKAQSIREALATTKSQKANLISRMARMGQATLPLKTSTGPSDSEEEIPVTATVKSKSPRNKLSNSNVSHHHHYYQENTEGVKQLSIYQNEFPLQHSKKSSVSQQLTPVFQSPVLSPTGDPSFSVYLSESRIQATELRMGISKISEKVDQVLNKIQNLQLPNTSVQLQPSSFVDSHGLLTSIQNLVTKNESLEAKVEEQKNKLELQNDKIFHLLELNQTCLEKNSFTFEKQSETESKLRQEMESVLKKELILEEDNKKSTEKIKILERQLQNSEEIKKKLEETSAELVNQLNKLKKEVEDKKSAKLDRENYDETMAKASEIVTKLKEKLKEAVREKEELKTVIRTQSENIETFENKILDLTTNNIEYEKIVKDLNSRILADESELKEKLSSYKKSQEKLEDEKKFFITKYEKEKENLKSEWKNAISQSILKLSENFNENEKYTKKEIMFFVSKCFDNVNTNKNELEIKENKGILDDKKFEKVFESDDMHSNSKKASEPTISNTLNAEKKLNTIFGMPLYRYHPKCFGKYGRDFMAGYQYFTEIILV
ncbi:leucine-rich repeat flightless-interacting protein, putative [Pediculus humanus corporis]|uniref:Leucine-rich repeat flightless-interacting protein, putative n=1 Tax=Pediculus humanus subsp. corporis TaxID=121224 RepID=E0VWF7_PEDHC|nr:leucine-rich repeat flightless-interacting protein, putative [Pediculus humanus corporis]EEB17708.1 leucine-rich repeat flightless-interacting protein, putative [Pediculus humanus corporis]